MWSVRKCGLVPGFVLGYALGHLLGFALVQYQFPVANPSGHDPLPRPDHGVWCNSVAYVSHKYSRPSLRVPSRGQPPDPSTLTNLTNKTTEISVTIDTNLPIAPRIHVCLRSLTVSFPIQHKCNRHPTSAPLLTTCYHLNILLALPG